MSIYTRQYIGEEKEIYSDSHSSEEFVGCINDIINLLIKYKMNIEETNAVFEMINEKLDATKVSVESVMNSKGKH